MEAFRGLHTASLCDCMERMAAISAEIRLMSGGRLLGPAFIVRVPQGDNLLFHAAMDLAEPGDVILVDAGGYKERAILGEMMASYCQKRGIAGIVCDGAVRDIGCLASMQNFPIYARAVTPNGPYKNGPGEVNVPIVIGGKTVHPGDIIAGDEDGVVIIDPRIAAEVAEAAACIEKKEAKILDDIQREGTYIRP